MAAEASTLVDAGTCRWCPHGQWSHKRGRGGCRELDCPCGQYQPPKDEPAAEPVLEVDPDSPVLDEAPAADDQDDDHQECGQCGDRVYTLSSRGWCDGCEEEAAAGPTDPGPTRRDLLARMTRESIDLGTYELTVPDGPRTASTCAYPDGEDGGEHDHALCEDVVAERVEMAATAQASPGPAPVQVATDAQLAEPGSVETSAAVKPPMPPADFLVAHTMVGERAAAGAGWQEGYLAGQATAVAPPDPALVQAAQVAEALAVERDEARADRDDYARRLKAADAAYAQAAGEAEEAQRRADALASELRSLEAEITAVTGQRDQAVADLERIGTELIAARREAKAATRARHRIRDELDAATLARLRLQEDLDEVILAGVAAAANVRQRYDAEQCETCGFRTTVPIDHEHPLTPVIVLVVRREAS